MALFGVRRKTTWQRQHVSDVERVMIDVVKSKLKINPDISHVGLCSNCEYARSVDAKESTVYFLCQRSLTDRSFPKYPRLPVLQCLGHVELKGAEHQKT